MLKVRMNWVLVCCLSAMVFSALKYIFNENSVSPSFVLIDILGLFILLVGIFLFVKKMGYEKVQEDYYKNELSTLKIFFDRSKAELQGKIDSFEHNTNEVEKWAIDARLIIEELRKLPMGAKHNVSNRILSLLARFYEMASAILYKLDKTTGLYSAVGTYAFDATTHISPVESGVGLAGQVIQQKEMRMIDELPRDYLVISSGLGQAHPCFLYFFPVIIGGNVIGLLEIASFKSLKLALVWNELNGEIANVLAKD